MIEKLVGQIEARFAELEREMSDPEVIGDRERYARVGREYRDLEPAAKLATDWRGGAAGAAGALGARGRCGGVGREYRDREPAAKLATDWRRAVDDAAGARELIGEDGDDPEVREMLATSQRRMAELEEEIRLAMVERDPNDDKNVIVEGRAGAGGDEAGLWAGDLQRMLSKYAERRGFQTESLAAGDGAYTFAVKGDGAYAVFKHEGGTHRVQRIPETESQGRIHTSTATVAVLPEAEDVDVDVDA